MTGNELMRMRTLQAVVLLIFGVIVLRLAYLQLFNPRYIELARANVLRHEVLYPRAARCSTATANTWCRAVRATT